MPEVDGAQLATKIKKDARLARIPLLLLTSVPQQSETARQMGFEGCLTKPIKGSALRQAIEASLGSAKKGSREPLPPASPPPGPPAGSRGRVLVVDDDPTSRKVAVELVERAGCQCHAVASGAAALEALDRETYDLVFMDCHMPEVDGYETTRRIREEHDRQERVVIVAMTGDAFAEDRARCLAAGMNDHVAKPVRTVDVERILARYLPAKGRRLSDPGAASTRDELRRWLQAGYKGVWSFRGTRSRATSAGAFPSCPPRSCRNTPTRSASGSDG